MQDPKVAWETKGVSRGRTAAWEHADLTARQCVVGWGKAHPFAIAAQQVADAIKADNDQAVHATDAMNEPATGRQKEQIMPELVRPDWALTHPGTEAHEGLWCDGCPEGPSPVDPRYCRGCGGALSTAPSSEAKSEERNDGR